MKFTLPFLFILAVTETLEAAPHPRFKQKERELSPLDILKSIQWRGLLAPFGILGVLGAVCGIVTLGRKADDAYTRYKNDVHANDWREFDRLPLGEREYLLNRFAEGKPGDKEWEERDTAHGYPTGKTPDTSGLDAKSKRKIEKAWKHYKKQVEKVEDLKPLKADVHQDNEKKMRLFTISAARLNKAHEEAIENMSKEEISRAGSQIGSSEST